MTSIEERRAKLAGQLLEAKAWDIGYRDVEDLVRMVFRFRCRRWAITFDEVNPGGYMWLADLDYPGAEGAYTSCDFEAMQETIDEMDRANLADIDAQIKKLKETANRVRICAETHGRALGE